VGLASWLRLKKEDDNPIAGAQKGKDGGNMAASVPHRRSSTVKNPIFIRQRRKKPNNYKLVAGTKINLVMGMMSNLYHISKGSMAFIGKIFCLILDSAGRF